MKYFFAWTKADWEAYLAAEGWVAGHAAAIFKHVYRDQGREPWTIKSLPVVLRQRLQNEFCYAPVKSHEARVSAYDASVKFLVTLPDGSAVEAVLMPEEHRLTLCLSSQVGCAQACVFCHTGRMGLKRQLAAQEIVGQLVIAEDWIAAHPDWLSTCRLPLGTRVSNVVFMGMGEPLDNVDNVMQAITIMTEAHGFSLSMKRISVSTAGHLDGLRRYLARFPRGTLALSLHATSEGERSRLMPINRRWPMGEVLGFLRDHYATHYPRGYLLVQYTLIAKVNDSEEHARALAALLQGIPVKVNIIPLNEVGPSRLSGPSAESLHRFRDALHALGLRVLVRYSKGQDIAAACGQLVVEAGAVQRSLA